MTVVRGLWSVVKVLQFLALGAMLLALSFAAEAQQEKVYRVGLLFLGRADFPPLRGLRDGLKEFGYVEGKNLVLDTPGNKTADDLSPVAKAYKEKRVHLIVTVGGTSTGIAKDVNQEIPIVFLNVTDPVHLGFVKSLARPGTNLTGLTGYPNHELQGKRLEIFKELVPTLRRVVVLYNARADAPHHTMGLGVVQKTAPNPGLKVTAKPVKLGSEIEPALASVSRENSDGIFMICSSLFRDFKKIANIAGEKRLPLMGCFARGGSRAGKPSRVRHRPIPHGPPRGLVCGQDPEGHQAC